MISAIFLIITVLIGLFILHSKWKHTYWKRKGIPYLEPEFFWGNTKDLFLRNTSFGTQFSKIYQELKSKGVKYGGYYTISKPGFMPVDIELIKCILQKDFSHFVNHGMFINEKVDPLTGHLFNLEDEKWRTLRTKLTPTFTSGKLKMMFPTLVECSIGLDDILKEHARMRDALDVKEVISRFTTDVIGSCAFGIDCNSLKNPDSEFRQFGRKIFNTTIWRRLLGVLVLLIPRKYLQMINYKQTRSDVEDFFMNVVRKTINYRETNDIVRKDFMHLLLQLKNRGTIIGEDEDVSKDTTQMTSGNNNNENSSGNYLSFNEIAAQCFVFFLAGFETSATTMTFALYELADNKNIQDKLRQEIDEILKKYNDTVTYEAIMEMTYLEKVINETLRKHPPVPGTPRVCNKAYQIPGTNHVIDVGTRLHIPFHGIHRDPEYYPNPEVFDPERFNDENKSKRPAFAFLPFGEGPRICIGARFGMMQIKVGLISVIRNYRVTVNKRMEIPLAYASNSFVTAVKGGVWLDVESIE